MILTSELENLAYHIFTCKFPISYFLIYKAMICWCCSVWNCWPLSRPAHDIETSCEWSQLCLPHPLWLHCTKSVSSPVHVTLSNQICPLPISYVLPTNTP